MAHRVTLIPGDGTGPELTEATRRVLEATGVEFDWDVQHAGTDVMEENEGNPLPDHVLAAIRDAETRRVREQAHAQPPSTLAPASMHTNGHGGQRATGPVDTATAFLIQNAVRIPSPPPDHAMLLVLKRPRDDELAAMQAAPKKARRESAGPYAGTRWGVGAGARRHRRPAREPERGEDEDEEQDLAGVCFDPSGTFVYVASVRGVAEWRVRGAEQRWWTEPEWA